MKILDYMDIQNLTFTADNTTASAEAFEALFGPVYLAKGLDEAKRLALKYVLVNHIDE